MYTRKFIFEIRLKTLRRGVWFKAITNLERNMLVLAAQIVNRVESIVLGFELGKIIRKLKDAMTSLFTKQIKAFGIPYARIIVNLAVGWGYLTVKDWNSDKGLVRYLTMIQIKQLSRCRI